MSDTIQVELPKEVARRFLRDVTGTDVWLKDVRAAVESALPPEYPEGTVADLVWDDGARRRVWWTGEFWSYLGSNDNPGWEEGYRVEPLRVLADDEIAVKRSKNDFAADYRAVARNARQGGFYMAAATADRYADALDAEKK